MIDVGQLAGVSQATVSLVLNNVPNARVSAKTRQRVLQAADELDYRKERRRPVQENRTRVIGLLLDEVSTTPFAMPFIEGARDEAALQDVVIAVFCTRSDPVLETAAIDMLMAQNAIGIIYASLVTRVITLPEHLEDRPVVMLNCYERKRRHTAVIPGDVAGGHTATEALLKAGHRRIAHLKGEDWIEATRDREKGYRQALTTWDVPVDEQLVMAGGWTVDGGRELTLKLLDLPNPPTGIFCFNDRMAIGAQQAAHERGLSVPDDLSIVGFDDEELSRYTVPPLSTVVLPHDEMARCAVTYLLDNYDSLGASQQGRLIKIECPYVERQSVAKHDDGDLGPGLGRRFASADATSLRRRV